MAAPGAAPLPGKIMVHVVDGARQDVASKNKLLVTVRDGEQNDVVKRYYNGPAVPLQDLAVYGNARDFHSVIVHRGGFLQAGFYPVKVRRRAWATVSLMLIRRNAGLQFARARWDVLKAQGGALFELLRAGAASGAEAEARYTDLLERRGECLAALLNITTALAAIPLATGSALDYCRALLWGQRTLLRDRFFGYADKALIAQVEQAVPGLFAPEPLAGLSHPGATRSVKEVRFGEANLQITFHENAPAPPGQVKLECDMDYYRDDAAHALLEVIPNTLTGRRTDPRRIYALRWMAGRQAGLPDFDPPYTLE